jgi:hypothetical protein
MDTEQMVEILESIILNEEAPATARCTAIRTLLEIAPADPSKATGFADLYQPPTRRQAASKGRRVRGESEQPRTPPTDHSYTHTGI